MQIYILFLPVNSVWQVWISQWWILIPMIQYQENSMHPNKYILIHFYALLLIFYKTYIILVTVQAVLFINRVDSRLAPSQWETTLHSNGVSQWLGANQESALYQHLTSMSLICRTCGHVESFPKYKFQVLITAIAAKARIILILWTYWYPLTQPGQKWKDFIYEIKILRLILFARWLIVIRVKKWSCLIKMPISVYHWMEFAPNENTQDQKS